MKLICTHCGYRFEVKKDVIPKICPYCGNSDCVEVEKSAQSLLDEVDEL